MLKLGWVPRYDGRSQVYHVKNLFSAELPRSYEWDSPLFLNQGQLSACVGFSFAHMLASQSNPATGVTEDLAINIYHSAQHLDGRPGANYEGTSVLAGVKAVHKAFPLQVPGYYWGSSIYDVVHSLGYIGPVNLGVNWYSDMFDPKEGKISVGGSLVGGHAILATAVNIEDQTIKLHNSWGTDWGNGGTCLISFADMERLINEKAEICVVTGKQPITL